MNPSNRDSRPLSKDSGQESEQAMSELRVIWEQSDRWAHLDDAQLERLFFFACVHYGRTCAPQDIVQLMQLYPLVAERLGVTVRTQVLLAVNDVVEQGTITVNAFLPFIQMDPELGVISSAALDFAMSMPLHDGDPLTGTKYLLSDVVGLPNYERVRVGTLIGLLLLGDRRVTRLLDRCWLGLSSAGRNQLSHAYSGWTYASTLEFFLDWLEDTQAREDESEFGMVAAAIANARAHSQHPTVLDIERQFPADASGAAAIQVLGEWTFQEYGSQLADRLAAAYLAESSPTVIDTVMELWDIPVPPRPSLDLGPVADALRRGAHAVKLQEAPTEPTPDTLLAWGYFNPAGPTASRIDALLLPDTGELLLVSASDHPMFPEYHAIALVPPGGDQAAAVRQVLLPIFEANGDGATWALIGSVPSYVHLFPGSPVDHACAAQLFRAGNAAGAARGELTDYRESIEDALRSWRDPWGQAAEAVTRVFEGADAQRLIARIRRLEVGDWFSDSDETVADGESSDQGDPIETDDLFDLWFALTAQPAYVERIEGQMGIAWTGAQAFRAGTFF
jgi:hypothetical protein